MTTTLLAPAPVVAPPAPALPLTDEQQDTLLLLAASTEKPQRVKRRGRTWISPGSSRAWSRGGNVD